MEALQRSCYSYRFLFYYSLFNGGVSFFDVFIKPETCKMTHERFGPFPRETTLTWQTQGFWGREGFKMVTFQAGEGEGGKGGDYGGYG